MTEEKGYKPSREELQRAEEIMTPEQKQMSALRERKVEELKAGEAEIATKELEYNEKEACKLGLERFEIKGNAEAQQLIEQVIDGSIDISNALGQKSFIDAWTRTCPDLPMPCVPEKNDFWYLAKLREKRIVSNLDGDPKPLTPHFDHAESVLVDSWDETDYNAQDARHRLFSPLINALLGSESVVNINRASIDQALWRGDPGDRIPTKKSQALLERLGVDPKMYELRLIAQDEYARVAKAKGLGTKNLRTYFDGYYFENSSDRDGLYGGERNHGGPSNVDADERDRGGRYLAVRLVLARKKHEI